MSSVARCIANVVLAILVWALWSLSPVVAVGVVLLGAFLITMPDDPPAPKTKGHGP